MSYCGLLVLSQEIDQRLSTGMLVDDDIQVRRSPRVHVNILMSCDHIHIAGADTAVVTVLGVQVSGSYPHD